MVNSPQANSPSKPTANTLKVLLVDDQKFVQHKLKQMLSTDANLEIVGSAGNGEMAIALVESLKPDVILIDIEMPKMNGIEATKIISQRFPDCKILIFSSYEHQEYVQKIIAAGADGYVLKSIPAEDLVTAIHSVCKGYSHFGSQLFKKIQLAGVDRALEDRLVPKTSVDNVTIESEYESEPPAIKKSSGADRWRVWGGISALTMIILAIPITTILKHQTIVKARAIVGSAEELHQVQSAVEGKVAEVLVEEGQKVKRGQAIATIDVSRSQAEQNQIIKSIEQQKLQLDRLNAQIASLSSQIIIAETRSNSTEIAAARSQLESLRRNYQNLSEVNAQLEASQKNIEAIETNLDAVRTKYNKYKSIAETGAITADRLSAAELEVSREEQKLAAARSQLERASATFDPIVLEIDLLRQQIEQAEQSSQATIANLDRERQTLIQRRIEINRQLEQDTEELNRLDRELAKSEIIATASGNIFELDLLSESQVRLGEQIARIVPENSKIQMKAVVSPQDITKFEVGQEVKMQVAACGNSNDSILGGTVAQITPDTNQTPTQKNSFLVKETSNTNYEVIIASESNTFGRQTDGCSLQIGSSGSVDIISQEETLLQHILKQYILKEA